MSFACSRLEKSNRFLVILAAVALLSVGCKKSESPTPDASTAGSAVPGKVSQINGVDIVKLERKAGDATKPEFLTATILPGRGMNLLQITANIPGKGEIPILFAPSIVLLFLVGSLYLLVLLVHL